MELTRILERLLYPPASTLLIMLAGLLLLRLRYGLGLGLIILGMTLLYLASTPLVSQTLMQQLQPYPALDVDQLAHPAAEAIIVLGGNPYTNAPEYGADSPGHWSLVRLRYAAWLQRRTGLPLLVTGGPPEHSDQPIAAMMATALEQEFRVPVRWQEGRARNTMENAVYSAALLSADDIQRVYVVTHAWHMPRAMQAFAHTGLTAIPAPTAFNGTTDDPLTAGDWFPRTYALWDTRLALHEMLGRVWYWLRY